MLTSTLASMSSWFIFVIDALIQATVLLALVAIAARFLRKRSAALRHLLWTLGIVGLVAAPVLASTIPFRVHLLPARETTSQRSRDVTDRAGKEEAAAPTLPVATLDEAST